MRTVGIKVLKNKLSEYVRMAERGETILIADRDRVVAELRPPGESRAPGAADAVLAGLIRAGVIRPALYPAGTPPPCGEAVARLEEILSEHDEDRADP